MTKRNTYAWKEWESEREREWKNMSAVSKHKMALKMAYLFTWRGKVYEKEEFDLFKSQVKI